MANERAPDFYGISERTAERGYLELRKSHLLKERTRYVPSARHPLGKRPEHHRALTGPYSTAHREELRKTAAKATPQAAPADGTPPEAAPTNDASQQQLDELLGET